MRNFFLFVFLLFAVAGNSQKDTQHLKKSQTKLITNDSVIEKIINRADSSIRKEILTPIDPGKSMDYFLQIQRENKAKQKRAAMIRIAIGVGFLVILIIGVSRRRRKKVE
jgi:hypothetical protein